jgi:predicted RNA binding protein YcfA (HicA-like mRNA interferase family)
VLEESNKFITFTMKYKELFQLLKQHGWYEVRQTGSHVIMKHPDRVNTITIPNHGSHEVKKGLFQAIIKQSGIKTSKR